MNGPPDGAARLPDCLLVIDAGAPPFIAWTLDRKEREIYLRADLRVTLREDRAARFDSLDDALAALRRIDALNEAEWNALYRRFVDADHALVWQVSPLVPP